MAVEVTVWAPVFVSYNDIQNEKAQSSKPASPSSPTRPPPPLPPTRKVLPTHSAG